MRKAASLLLTVTFLTMCVACQPTPEEEYITPRDGDLIEEKIEAGSPKSTEQAAEPEEAVSYKEQVEAYKASLPQHWSEKLESASVLNVDTDIVVNNTDSFPVYTIARGKFDMEQMEIMANRFFSDVTEIGEAKGLSQDEYAAAITSLNERGEAAKANILVGEMQYAPVGKYAEADHITLQKTGSQEYKVRLADGTMGEVCFSLGYGMDYMFFKSHRYSIVHVQEDLRIDGSYEGEGSVILEPAITQEQGEEMVNSFMQENGLEGFTVASVTAARNFEILPQREISQGWQFILMRTYGYQAVFTSNPYEGGGWITYEDDTTYSQPWRRESIEIYVSENGVEFFQWSYPMEVTEIAAENVELLDFEQIQNSIRKLLPVCTATLDGTGWRGEINQMTLTVVAQQAKDDPDTAYLMPVWVISIDWYLDYAKQATQRTSYSLFGINALDGSRAIMRKEDW